MRFIAEKRYKRDVCVRNELQLLCRWNCRIKIYSIVISGWFRCWLFPSPNLQDFIGCWFAKRIRRVVCIVWNASPETTSHLTVIKRFFLLSRTPKLNVWPKIPSNASWIWNCFAMKSQIKNRSSKQEACLRKRVECRSMPGVEANKTVIFANESGLHCKSQSIQTSVLFKLKRPSLRL